MMQVLLTIVGVIFILGAISGFATKEYLDDE